MMVTLVVLNTFFAFLMQMSNLLECVAAGGGGGGGGGGHNDVSAPLPPEVLEKPTNSNNKPLVQFDDGEIWMFDQQPRLLTTTVSVSTFATFSANFATSTTMEIQNDITFTSALTISGVTSLVINGNGHTLNGAYAYYLVLTSCEIEFNDITFYNFYNSATVRVYLSYPKNTDKRSLYTTQYH
jgi:hypothetical protein